MNFALSVGVSAAVLYLSLALYYIDETVRTFSYPHGYRQCGYLGKLEYTLQERLAVGRTALAVFGGTALVFAFGYIFAVGLVNVLA